LFKNEYIKGNAVIEEKERKSSQLLDTSVRENSDFDKVNKTPTPIVVGNSCLRILNHSFQIIEPYWEHQTIENVFGRIDLSIRNVSDKTIATAVFEINFYDLEGNTLKTVRHNELDLKSNTSRAFFVVAQGVQPELIKNYRVDILKIVTTEVEKVQLCKYEATTTEFGYEELTGIVKNISDTKTDAALVATFKDHRGEKIGTRIVNIKDIEPMSIKQFQFIFKTPIGETIKTCTFDIGEMVKEI
jgi:hypothetical protein